MHGMALELSLDRIRSTLQAYGARRSLVPALRPAAVLIPLFHDETDEQTKLWLIRRPDDGTPHGGQVALPGGKPTAADATMRDTALREAYEELGIPSRQVEVLGELDEYVTITGFKIRPVVGWLHGQFEPRPNPAEVERAFAAPLSVFLQPSSTHLVRWSVYQRMVPSHAVDGEIIWGATFSILRGLGSLLSS